MNHYNVQTHLTFIHNTINRMNTNTIAIKGLAFTILVASLGLSFDKKIAIVNIFAMLATLGLWLYTSYFLQLERKFRRLYNSVRTGANREHLNYSMDIRDFNNKECSFINAFTSTSMLMFYLPQLFFSFLAFWYNLWTSSGFWKILKYCMCDC